MGKLTGKIKNISRKYFTLEMENAGERRLHIDANHCWKDFNVKAGDVVKVTLHPVETNGVVGIMGV